MMNAFTTGNNAKAMLSQNKQFTTKDPCLAEKAADPTGTHRLERGEDPILPGRGKQTEIAPLASTPPSRMRTASAERATADGDQSISFILEKLRKDPSLRLSDSGRELLRLLQLQCTALERWPQFAEQLPDHCTDVVMLFARQCAEEWDAAAKALQKRGTSARIGPGDVHNHVQ